jgi:hypothetical protein
MHPVYRTSLNPPLDRPIWPWVVGGIAAASIIGFGVLYSRSARAAITTPTPSNGNGGNGNGGNGNGAEPIPTNGGLVPPVGATTKVQDPVTGQIYDVPLPQSPSRATRSQLGVILPTPNLLLGQRLGWIETWPTGAEMLWGLVKTVGPARAYYDVVVAESIPYQGAYHDTRPSQLADHQTAGGTTVRVMPTNIINAIV